MIKVENITKSFIQNNHKIEILKSISFSVNEGEIVSIIGPSGSGKSTLLSIISGMDKPDEGSVIIDEQEITKMDEEKLCKIRNQKIGVIFQAFELIQSFSALENVMLPLDIAMKKSKEKSTELLGTLGLGERLDHLPKMLSGGEQQRVAIARALINDPKIIFADEPTGNLDVETGLKVIEILFDLIKKFQKTLIIITHDNSLAKKSDRIFRLKNGQLKEINNEELYI